MERSRERTRRHGWALAVVSVLAGLVAAIPAAPAGAATGDLSYVGCIADLGGSGCVNPAKDPLFGARGVTVSPDGASTYVASQNDNAVSHFTRAADGSIAFAACIADLGAETCTDPPADVLGGAHDVAISPDGQSAYVPSASDDSITHFTRAADGSLAFAGCFGPDGFPGCTDPPQDPLDAAFDVAVSPDGNSVYVTASNSNAISHFLRAPNGTLFFVACVANGGLHGCADPGPDSLTGAQGVDVSPDGKSVYVASTVADSITHFTRASSGFISFSSCVAEAGVNGCANPTPDALDGARNVAVSPEGTSVYATAEDDDAVTHLTRAGDGSLTLSGCVANAGASGCADPPQESLDGAIGLAVSQDGHSVYVTSNNDDSVTHLARGAGGSLAFAGCVAELGGSGCADPAQDALNLPLGVTVSPDGSSVYVTAFTDSSISHFARELPPAPPPPSTSPSAPPAVEGLEFDSDPPETAIEGSDRFRTRRKKREVPFRISSSEQQSTLACSVDHGPFEPCGSTYVTPKLKRGDHVIEAQATDAAGNTDPTPAVKSFTIKRKR